jgi:hypothetical protein
VRLEGLGELEIPVTTWILIVVLNCDCTAAMCEFWKVALHFWHWMWGYSLNHRSLNKLKYSLFIFGWDWKEYSIDKDFSNYGKTEPYVIWDVFFPSMLSSAECLPFRLNWTKLCGLSPRANYIDQAITACRQI